MLRAPKVVDLRADPFERATEESIYYHDWLIRRMFVFVPAQAGVAQFLETFKEFPPRQRPASYTIDQVHGKDAEGAGREQVS